MISSLSFPTRVVFPVPDSPWIKTTRLGSSGSRMRSYASTNDWNSSFRPTTPSLVTLSDLFQSTSADSSNMSTSWSSMLSMSMPSMSYVFAVSNSIRAISRFFGFWTANPYNGYLKPQSKTSRLASLQQHQNNLLTSWCCSL